MKAHKLFNGCSFKRFKAFVRVYLILPDHAPTGTHFTNPIIHYKYITIINMVHLIREKMLNLDTKWCIVMIILSLKIFNRGHLGNSILSLLIAYNLIRFCTEKWNKNFLRVNRTEKERKKSAILTLFSSSKNFGYCSWVFHLHIYIYVLKFDSSDQTIWPLLSCNYPDVNAFYSPRSRLILGKCF